MGSWGSGLTEERDFKREMTTVPCERGKFFEAQITQSLKVRRLYLCRTLSAIGVNVELLSLGDIFPAYADLNVTTFSESRGETAFRKRGREDEETAVCVLCLRDSSSCSPTVPSEIEVQSHQLRA